MNVAEMKELFCKPTDERALLSYCFKNMNNFYDLTGKLDSGDFLHPHHSTLFSLMGALSQQDIASFDMPMVINYAQQAFGSLSSLGGIEYVQSIGSMRIDQANLGVYLQNVLESSTKYKLFDNINADLEKIKDNAKDGLRSEELIGSIERKILDLSTESQAIREPRNLADGLRELIEERMANPVKQLGLSTGYKILDKQIDGLVPGTLNIISARPKKGKSTFLSNVAAYLAYKEEPAVPILYIDTEMPFDQWRDRIVSNLSGIEERSIKHGGYSQENYQKIMTTLKLVETGKLFHEFMPGYNIDKLTALYKKYKLKHNIGLMIFDYIKEPDSNSIDRNRKEYQVLGDVTTRLKDLAGTLNIPCLTAVQVNREGSVADSDRIIRYADTIMQWMDKSEKEIDANAAGYKGGQYKLVVRETRRGGMTPDEGIGYLFKKTTLTIEEAEGPDQLIKYGDKVLNQGDSGDDVQ